MTHQTLQSVKQITIVGTGLLGSSIGLALRGAGWGGKIIGVGRRAKTVEQAQQLGCIDQGTTKLGPAVRDSQLVVLATPLGWFTELLSELGQHDHEGLVMTDVGSTKQFVCDQANQSLPEPSRFVGSHPMAGSEQHGPGAARAQLFQGKPCVICPHDNTDPVALGMVKELWDMLGMRVIEMSAPDHDRTVAKISHLPHAVAAVLLGIIHDQGGLDLASTGFRDTTRVASGDPAIWKDIFSTNPEALIESIDEFANQLSQLRQALQQKDGQSLLVLLKKSKATRDHWVQKFNAPKNNA